MSSDFNTSPNFIRRLELLKSIEKQKQNKLSLCSQTYFPTIVIPLSRIRAINVTLMSNFIMHSTVG